jgi:hypothetical protein
MLRIGLEFLIEIHDVEKIEKLPLIGVKPLDLGIIDRIRVDLDFHRLSFTYLAKAILLSFLTLMKAVWVALSSAKAANFLEFFLRRFLGSSPRRSGK